MIKVQGEHHHCNIVLVLGILISILTTMVETRNLPSVSRLKDGQSMRDKYIIVRLMNLLERQKARQLGFKQKIPWSMQYVFEGDIILQKDQALRLVNNNKHRKKRKMDTAVTEENKKWTLPINYVFEDILTKEQRAAILRGIERWEYHTCITFNNDNVDLTSQKIKFINDSECYSFVGMTNDTKEQVVAIGRNCTRLGTVEHEIGHALGFWHEHARADRDEYINVTWKYIEIGRRNNFYKTDWKKIDNLGLPYDYGSVMHYNSNQFAKGDYITMETINPLYQNTIGQRHELSFLDAKLANKVYCKDVCNTSDLTSTCLHDGYQDPKNCSRCRCPDGLSGDYCELVAPSDPQCGGTIILSSDSKHTITSPGYPYSFEANVRCYWLIKSPNGTAINIQFRNPFMQSRSCNEYKPHKPCDDFVEVRFAANLGLTGGRFCCNTDLQRLSTPIVSHSNNALILFQTYSSGVGGISAELTIDSCGGCYNSVISKQVSCARKVTQACYQTWYVVVKLASCSSWWGVCSTGYRQQARTRLTQCYTEEPYCCQGYTLSSDRKHCLYDTDTIVKTESTTTSAGTNTIDNNNTVTGDVEADQGTSSDWTIWSSWQSCSVTCGGGIQSRSRTCQSGSCTGDSEETRVCGQTSCDSGNVLRTCSKSVVQSYTCLQNFEWTTCYRSVTEYYTQTSNCCCGYDLVDGSCTRQGDVTNSACNQT